MLVEMDLMMVMKNTWKCQEWGRGKRAMSPPTKDTSLHTNLFWSARLMRRVGSDIFEDANKSSTAESLNGVVTVKFAIFHIYVHSHFLQNIFGERKIV